MDQGFVHISKFLLPLSWLYGVGVEVRNWLYDRGWLRSQEYGLPVIGVGNITVGGTGKTPHTEYLVRLLASQYRVAVLSRGYKRKSKGYRLAANDTPMELIGDEPWQMKQKFGEEVIVAVDADRRHGIERLQHDEATSNVEVIVLDDAFQHRAVKAGLNLLLVDYNRLITDDCLLPAGRLREPASAKHRADIVVVSKCPRNISPIDYSVVQQKLALRPFQSLFFSTLRYGLLQQLFSSQTHPLEWLKTNPVSVLLLTSIGNPRQMEADLRQFTERIQPLSFPDHHYFSERDIELVRTSFDRLPKPRIVITTEKDAARLLMLRSLPEELKEKIYVLPVEVEIMRNESTMFNQKILSYVRKNS